MRDRRSLPPREPPDALSLVVLGDRHAAVYPLPPGGRVVIGRGTQCDVRVDDASVSRRHAVLEVGPPLRVTDLGSANGTRVGARALAPEVPAEFAVGEVLEVGSVAVVVQPRARAAAETPGEGAADPHGEPAAEGAAGTIVVADPASERLYELVRRAARTGLDVLVRGEPGCGKEVVARAIHRGSERAAGPFIVVDCRDAAARAALARELSGDARALAAGERGPLRGAGGGVVFLDRVDALPTALQIKLARALEERAVPGVAPGARLALDVRVVASTEADLAAAAAARAFWPALYARLQGVLIAVPPLRARRGEVAPLARLFAARARPPAASIAPAALAAMSRYDWPGNVRELAALVAGAAAQAAGGAIELAHLPSAVVVALGSEPPSPARRARAGEGAGVALRGELDAIERHRILDALEKCGGNQSRAAKLLAMPRRTLVKRLREYGVARPRAGRAR